MVESRAPRPATMLPLRYMDGRGARRSTEPKRAIEAGNQATYPHDHDPAPDPLQHLHDVRLVWPSEVSPRTAVQGHRYQLDNRLCGVLFSGAGQPHRILRVHDGAVEDHTGGHHPNRVFDLLRSIST